jgi:uncharacterized membrane protein
VEDLWLTIHILAAALWFGAGFFMNLLMARLSMKGEQQAVAGISTQTSFISRFFDTAAIVTLVAGVALVLTVDAWEFSDPFVSIGFAGVLITLGIGHGMITPTSKKLAAALAAGNAEEAQALGQRMGMLSTIDSLVLLLVIIAMVVKPFA